METEWSIHVVSQSLSNLDGVRTSLLSPAHLYPVLSWHQIFY